MDSEFVRGVWAAIGREYRAIQRGQVYLLTDALPERSKGGIYLPARMTDMSRGLPHNHVISATVVAVGPNSTLSPGDRVAFTRLFWTWLHKLSDGRQFGTVKEANLHFQLAPDYDVSRIESVR